MTGTTPTIRKKNEQYQGNVNKRGHVKPTLIKKKENSIPVSYTALGILLFLVVGGAILQMFNYWR